MDKIIVSSCILGNNTKYNGGNNYNPLVERLKEKYIIIPICPEVMGGLGIPRIPSERINDRVINKNGDDVTNNYLLGLDKVLKLIENEEIKYAVLKDGSPSCGSKFIYDGTFTGNKIRGMGITAECLSKLGIKIITEKEIEEIL